MEKRSMTLPNGILIEFYWGEKDKPKNYSGGVHFVPVGDLVKPCPFCGDVESLELSNTHTPIYEIECRCGAKMEGDYHDPYESKTFQDYCLCRELAIKSVMKLWDTRA